MDLPVEVIQHIFYFLSPCEIVRLRQVSKQFHDITSNAALWRRVYANAGLLLPPGPFSSQSTRYLERTLVQSALVSKTWTSHPLKMHSRTLSSWKREGREWWTVVFGRWCIFLQGQIIQCHDVDNDTYRSLYDGTAHPGFRLMVCTATSDNGKRVCLLLVDWNHPNELIRMLESYVNDDSFSEPEIIDRSRIGSQSFDPARSTDDLHSSGPFMVISKRQPCVVLDLRTRCLYRLPVARFLGDLSNVFKIHPALPQSWYDTSAQVILTRTHVITVQMLLQYSRDVYVLIQAFVALDSAILRDRIEVGKLSLTHQAAIRTSPRSFSLLRDSIVDPVTGSVNIRLLHITTAAQIRDEPKGLMSSLDLTLPKPVSTAEVLPISIRSQRLFEDRWTSQRYTASSDGYARGLLLMDILAESLWFRSISARKFAIDASGDACTIVVGDPCPVDFAAEEDEVVFDGTRGRIHLFQSISDVNQVVTIDLT